MNESNLLYRLFIDFCVTTVLGLLAVLVEYSLTGEGAVSMRILWYVIVSGAVVGSTVELLFVNILPISGNNLKRNVLWRNRLIAALVNAVLAAVLGRFMLGAGNLFVLFLIAVAACVIAVLVAGVISDIRYRHSIEEMNRRLKQLNSITGGHTGTDGE